MSGSLLGVFALLAAAGAMMWWLMSMPDTPPPVRFVAADPLYEAARRQARGSVDEFRRLVDAHPGRGMVKQRIDRPDGRYRGRWADVVECRAAGVVGRLRGSGRVIELGWAEIEDWQVTLPDGSFRGAFTVIAGWRIQERVLGHLPPDGVRALARFHEATDGAASTPPPDEGES